jgi:hypothetical protein
MIWISQWLCPKRHCSIALAWDEEEETEESIERKGEEIYASGSINRHCGICGGGLHVEHEKTIFKTLAEGGGPLKEQERANIQTLAWLQASRN